MEGNLFKWTNYLFGWRERYFVLKGSVFYYYYKKGDKPRGRLHLSVCQINFNPNDTKFELDSGIAVLYLKAESVEVRDMWLKALKNAKKEAENRTLRENQNLIVGKDKQNEDNLNIKILNNENNFEPSPVKAEFQDLFPNNYNTNRSSITEDKLLTKISSLNLAVNSLEKNNEFFSDYIKKKNNNLDLENILKEYKVTKTNLE
jgi:hypothetical protein